MTHRNQKMWQAASCLLSALVAIRYSNGLGETEFAGGRVTGPILDLFYSGTLLFVLALLLTFIYRRIAAAIALAASLFCLPLYLDFTARAPFRSVFAGQHTAAP